MCIRDRFKYRGVLIGNFVKYNWKDWGYLPMNRGFTLDVKAYLKKDQGFNYVSSMHAKIISLYGIKFGGKKIIFKPRKHQISNDTCTQIIDVQIEVEDFGSESTSTSVGVNAQVAQGATSYGESAPIGRGIYKTTLVFTQAIEGDNQTVDFDANDTTILNLPTLEFDNKLSSLLQSVSN